MFLAESSKSLKNSGQNFFCEIFILRQNCDEEILSKPSTQKIAGLMILVKFLS